MTKKGWMLLSIVALVGGIALVSLTAATAADSESNSNAVKIASLVKELDSMTPGRLNSLEAIPIRRFELPEPGVDVMRARLRETYSVDGVGTDTVELSGWIAVKHDNARPAHGEVELNWGTAVVDTEFMAMDLSGHSDVFGPVRVTLDRSRPSRGQVGRIEIPELARAALLARLDTSERDKEMKIAAVAAKGKQEKIGKGKAPAQGDKGKAPAAGEKTTTTRDAGAATAQPVAVCSAPVVASISMPDLGLQMNTKTHVYWYSLVDTIPPVGHTASVAVEPVRLISAGREVGTLVSGEVTFREVVRHVSLTDNKEKLASQGR